MTEFMKMTGLIKNQIQVLEEQLAEEKQNYASCHLDENSDWRCRDSAKMKCKVIEGQIYILKKTERGFIDMGIPALASA